jgi:ADP-glucose pyrophosphorylase
LKQGEKISNLVNASQNSYSFTFDYLQKTLKRIFKTFAKTKTCGASVVQNVKNKETIHAYPMIIFIDSIPSNLCTYKNAN